MTAKNGDNKEKDPLDGFRFHEELLVAKREIAELYHPAVDVKVYRTCVTNPPSKIDITAKSYRNREDDAEVSGGMSQKEYDALKKKKKIEYLSERSLSVNDSRGRAEISGKQSYQTMVKKYDEEIAEIFMEEERGTYIGGFILRQGQAIMTDFVKGHAEVILNEGVRPEDLEIFEELTKYDYKDE